jgi:hypothetical protein
VIRYINSASGHLNVMLISLILTACGSPSVSVTPASIVVLDDVGFRN